MSEGPSAPGSARHAELLALAEKLRPELHRYSARLMGSVIDGEDVVQDTFARAFAALDELEESAPMRAWLFRIANNSLIDSRRGPRAVTPKALPESLASREQGPVAAVVSQESLTLVQEACERLPVKLKAALLLRTQEDLSFEEIGAVLNVTEETIRWRVFKARHLLVNDLKNYLDGKSS